jgi:hypothetical protein
VWQAYEQSEFDWGMRGLDVFTYDYTKDDETTMLNDINAVIKECGSHDPV